MKVVKGGIIGNIYGVKIVPEPSKRILLTGIGGFIGTHLMEHILINTDWEIVGVDSFDYFRHRGSQDRLSDCTHYQANKDRVKLLAWDLTIPFTPMFANKIGRIDYIINMASQSHVDRSIEDPVPFIQNNINLILTMLEYARMAKPEVFIQISTDEVYGPMYADRLHPEWDSIIPSNPYSASKCAQEAIAISYWRTYGVPVVITNTMNNFGEYQDSEKFIPLVIKSILNSETVHIHGDKNGAGSRFYIHARNHSDALLFILKNTKPSMYINGSARPDRYNVKGSKEVDNLTLAQMIADILQLKLKHKIADVGYARPGHDLKYGLDSSKLNSLGWTEPIKWEDSLEKTVKWYLNHKEYLGLK